MGLYKKSFLKNTTNAWALKTLGGSWLKSSLKAHNLNLVRAPIKSNTTDLGS